MLHYSIKPFAALTLNELYSLLALRIKVFVIEQDCIYQDLDGKDAACFHLMGLDEAQNLLATARILPAGVSYPEVAIGRVTIDESARGTGEGHQLMQACMDFIRQTYGAVPVTLSAQKHLENFYASHHFTSTGKEYLEDGIPHVEMKYHVKNHE
jgi:ElaA protein